VILIEHNLRVIADADHIIDLGPGGGDAAGTVVATGPPERIASSRTSLTGAHLKRVLHEPSDERIATR